MTASRQAIAGRRTVGACLLVLAAAGTLLVHRRSASSSVSVASGRGGPRDLAFTLLDRRPWHLSDHRGHVVAINLWATWCAPCRSETPALVRTEADLSSRGFEVLGVSLDTARDRQAQVDAFRSAYRVTYPMAFPDPMSQIGSALEGIPTTLLFDRQGRAAKIYAGQLDEQDFRADVETLLNEPAAALYVHPAKSER